MKKVEDRTIDFENDDGTVDEWVYKDWKVVQVTVGIRRRNKKQSH